MACQWNKSHESWGPLLRSTAFLESFNTHTHAQHNYSRQEPCTSEMVLMHMVTHTSTGISFSSFYECTHGSQQLPRRGSRLFHAVGLRLVSLKDRTSRKKGRKVKISQISLDCISNCQNGNLNIFYPDMENAFPKKKIQTQQICFHLLTSWLWSKFTMP